MTSADTMSAQSTEGASVGRSSMLVRPHAAASLAFLLVGVALLLAATLGTAWPEAIESLGLGEWLSYGRAMPAALNALVFGWLTLGLLAFIHHAMPRIVGQQSALPIVALASGLVIAAGTAAGVAAIVLGEGAGGRLLEMPWYADLSLVMGSLGAAVAVSATARGAGSGLPVAAWYMIAGPWWLFFSQAAGSIPGLQGAPAEIQSAFTATAVYGLWLAPAAIGGGYYLVARLVPDASFHPRLGRIGFWSLGFTWVWTAARTLQYGPTPDWMETIPVLFGAGLAVTAITLATDFAFALRGRWDEVWHSVSLRLFVAGMGLFVIVTGHMLLQSLRSSSTVVRFTAWETAFEYLTVFGAFTLWTAGLLVHLGGSFTTTSWGRALGRLTVIPLAGGILFAIGTRWVAGLQQGYTWLGGVSVDTHDNFGEGFRNTVAPLIGTDRLTFIGLAVASAGLLVFVVGTATGLARLGKRAQRVGSVLALAALVVVAFSTAAPVDGIEIVTGFSLAVVVVGTLVFIAARAGGAPPAVDEEVLEFEWPEAESLGTIRRGAAFVFALAAVAVFALPALESGAEASVLADATRDFEEGSAAELGQQLYIAEGCWYCHTQQVRPIVTDVGLGPVSALGDYAYDPVGTFGVARLGPDLAHAGSREPTDSVSWVADHLRDPRVERPWSNMPAYDHLTDGELAALATYVAGLE